MAINSSRLVVSPTTERSENKTPCVYVSNTIPPAGRIVVVDGLSTFINQNAEYEGQLLCYTDGSIVQLYVVVDIGGVLTWKLAHFITEYIDSTTGKPMQSN